MASVAPPKPSYRPRLPANLVSDGLLSDAQLATVIYADEAHGDYLAGAWTVDDTFDLVSAARDDAPTAVRFRRGFMLGDGTGKGYQSAAIILDNWHHAHVVAAPGSAGRATTLPAPNQVASRTMAF